MSVKMNKSPQVICVASTMRSGSTLLKALLAEAEDVSNLPEKDFQKYAKDPQALENIRLLDPHPIIVLKRPGWYNEVGRYPRLPLMDGLRTVLLIRDVYDTVESLRKMTFRRLAPWVGGLADSWLAKRYWLGMTQALLSVHENPDCQTHLIRYEDLTADPIERTRELFQFIGSERTEGIDTYSKPDNFRWRWGSDDNSTNIKSLRVQSRPGKPQTNARLLKIMEDPAIMNLRRTLGYIAD